MGLHHHHVRRLGGALVVALSAFVLGNVGTASASNPMVTVSQGVNPAKIPGSRVFGNTPASTPETVSFVLRAQNLAQLERLALQSPPADLTTAQFAATYGQTSANIAALQNYLAGFGIATQVYPDGLDIVATGRAGNFDKALDVNQQQFHVPAHSAGSGMRAIPAQTVYGSASDPQLPQSIAPYVVGIFGLSNYSALDTHTVKVDQSLLRPGAAGTSGCVALTGLAGDCHLPSDFASGYGLSSLYQHHAQGQGETIGIVTFAALDPGAPQYFWKNVQGLPATSRTVTVDNVDGGPGAPSDASGTGETDLDVEQSGGVAPQANVVVYQAPGTDPGWFDAFFTAASQNVADTVSCSWGESEDYLRAAIASGGEAPAYQAANDEAFLELAVQGQSNFTASGDYGAYGAQPDLGTTDLSVGTPDDSPYESTVGGTTLPWSGTLTGPTGITAKVTVSAERIWGWDYLWAALAKVNSGSLSAAAESNIGGSEGGFSVLEPQPTYQAGVSGTSTFTAVPYLTPIDPSSSFGITRDTAWDFNPNPGLVQGTGTGRAEPDLATNSDPYSGYLLYEPSATAIGQPALQGGWGGTSFASPEMSGSAAVIDSLLGRRTGLWNPAIYKFATGSRSPFTPLNQSGPQNDNLYYTGTRGTLFNEGAGLGTPNLSQIEADFAAQP